MDFLERDLEDILFECMCSKKGREILEEHGLDTNGVVYRQVELGTYGRIDLMTVELDISEATPFLIITVYELKRNMIDVNALMQGARYITGLRDILSKYDNINAKNVDFRFRLIGKDIDKNGDFVFLYNLLNMNVEVYTFDFDIEGMFFNYEDKSWVKKNEGFSNPLFDQLKAPGFKLLRHLIRSTI